MAQIRLAGGGVVGMVGRIDRGAAFLETPLSEQSGKLRLDLCKVGIERAAAFVEGKSAHPAVSRGVVLGMADDDRRLVQRRVVGGSDGADVVRCGVKRLAGGGGVVAGFENCDSVHAADYRDGTWGQRLDKLGNCGGDFASCATISTGWLKCRSRKRDGWAFTAIAKWGRRRFTDARQYLPAFCHTTPENAAQGVMAVKASCTVSRISCLSSAERPR